MKTIHTAKPKRLLELDGLRGIAALGVALFHLRIFLQGEPNPLAIIWGLDVIIAKGWHLVDLFFVLSGFIFAHCYLVGGEMRKGVSFKSFAWARFSRLWPLHCAVLCFTAYILAGDQGTTAFNFVMSLAMLHVFLPDIEVLNPPVWSISVEFICYAIFAALALKTNSRLLLYACATLVCLGIALTLTQAMPYVGRGLLGFFLGCLVYNFRRPLNALPSPILLAGSAMFFFVGNSYIWLVVEVLVCWPSAIMLAQRCAVLRHGVFQWLGSRSYAIYLLHVPLFILTANVIRAGPAMPVLVDIGLALGLTFLVADILYRRLEMPAQQALRRRSLAKPRPSVAS